MGKLFCDSFFYFYNNKLWCKVDKKYKPWLETDCQNHWQPPPFWLGVVEETHWQNEKETVKQGLDVSEQLVEGKLIWIWRMLSLNA